MLGGKREEENVGDIIYPLRVSGRGEDEMGRKGGILRYSINSNFHTLRVHKAIEVEISIERS